MDEGTKGLSLTEGEEAKNEYKSVRGMGWVGRTRGKGEGEGSGGSVLGRRLLLHPNYCLKGLSQLDDSKNDKKKTDVREKNLRNRKGRKSLMML